MSDKVVFQQDGSYSRGPVDEMDVHGKKRRSLADVATSKGTARKPAAKKPVPGSFDLASLRASARSATAAKTTLPKQNESTFSKVETVESHKLDIQPVAAKEEKHEVASPSPTIETVSAQKEESAVADVPAPVVAKEPEPVKQEMSEQETPAVEAPIAAVEATADDAISLSRISETDSTPQVESNIVAPEVQEMKLEEHPTAVEPTAETVAEEVSVTAGQLSAEFAGAGFRVVALSEFVSKLGLDTRTVAEWSIKCVSAAVKTPTVIFTAGFNEDVRFYNFILSTSGKYVDVILGYGDSITCARVTVSSKDMQDQSQILQVNGEEVLADGAVVVFYEERLKASRRV